MNEATVKYKVFLWPFYRMHEIPESQLEAFKREWNRWIYRIDKVTTNVETLFNLEKPDEFPLDLLAPVSEKESQ
jgi:hypothetical protein